MAMVSVSLVHCPTPVDCTSTEVQARAARIQACQGFLVIRFSRSLTHTYAAAVVTLMNLLSAVSTGFWSRLGDNYGRKPVTLLFLVGAIAM